MPCLHRRTSDAIWPRNLVKAYNRLVTAVSSVVVKNCFRYSLAVRKVWTTTARRRRLLNMARQLVLFGSLLFVGLTAGAAFVVWFIYNPDGMSSAFYIETMQHSIRRLTIPLPTIVVLGLLFSAGAFLQSRYYRPVFFLACHCMLVRSCRWFNHPIWQHSNQ